LFSRTSCDPCNTLDEFLNEINDTRVDRIQKINIQEGLASEEELATAEKYGIRTTPALVVTNHDDVVLEEHSGALDITRNLRRILETRLGG
tara:strand:+ start:87 stop:359 length:273 start_codon:yes stop_codon:yes gene_type:complete